MRPPSPPPGAHRALALGLVLALFIPVLPGGVVAQDGDSIRLSDSFVVEGDSASADVIYTCTIAEPDVRWRLEATRPVEDVGITVDLRDADKGLSLRSSGNGTAGLPDLAPGEPLRVGGVPGVDKVSVAAGVGGAAAGARRHPGHPRGG